MSRHAHPDRSGAIISTDPLEAVFEETADGVFIADSRGCCTDVNPAGCRMLGYSRAELLALSFQDIFSHCELPAGSIPLDLVPAQGAVARECLLRCKDGTALAASIRAQRLADGRVLVVVHDTSGARRLEEDVRTSEQRYRHLFENMLNGFAFCRMLYGDDGRPLDFEYLEVNAAFETLTGLKDVVGRKVTEIIPGIRETNPELFEIYGRVALTGSPEQFETYLEVLGIWFSVSVYSPEKGCFVAVFENVTESRGAQEALRNSETRLRRLLENGLDNVSLLSADGTLIWESPTSNRTWGSDPNALAGLNMFALVHPDDRAALHEQFVGLLREPGGRISAQFRLLHADGSWRWVEAVGSNLLREPGVEAIVVNYRDITPRLEAEEGVRRSEERYRYLFENNPHPMWVYDLQTLAFLAVNDAAVDKYGYSREEFLGMTIADIRPREDLQRLVDHVAGRRTSLEHSTGWRHRLKDGSLIDVAISSHTIELEGRSAALVIAQDVTEQKQAEARIQYVSRLYATMSQVNQTIVRVKERDQLFQTVCDVAVEFGKFRMVWIGLLNRGTGRVTPTAHSGLETGYLNTLTIDVYDEAQGSGPVSSAIRSGQAVFVDDIATDPGFRPWRERALERGYRSCAAVPIRQGGMVIGAFALYAPESSFFNQEEMRLLEEIGQDISFALDGIEAEANRKRLESERQRLLDAIENSLNEIYIFDAASLRFEYVNQGALRNLGYTAQQMREMTPLDLKPEFTMQSFEELIAPLLQGEKQTVVFETVHRRADRSLYPVEVHLQLIRRDDSAAFLAVIMDITERRRTAAQLRETEQRYRSALSSMMEGCQVIDYDWRIIYVNDAAARQSRRPPEALLMQRMPDLFPGFEQTHLFSVLEDCMRKRIPQRIENEFIFPDGPSGWFELSIQPVPEGLFILSMDITGRKQAEAELKASEAKYRSLFDEVPDGVYRTTPDGQFLAANPALVRMLGYDSLEQLQSVNVRDTYADASDRSNFVDLLASTSEVHNLEVRLRRWDGAIIVCLNNGRVIRDEAGAPLYYEGTLTDITGHKEAQQRIQQQLSRITALRDVDRLITTSLDLRLTMKQILGQAERQLGADASAGLVLDANLNTLHILVSQGLPESALSRSGIRLGNGLAGKVAMERQFVHYPDLRQAAATIPEARPLVEAGFAEYYGLPLSSRGQLKGVLEVYRRLSRRPDPDWLEYLETLAGQAALAIDSIQMFEGLNRSNLELAEAYDATIEGWSRVLDLRYMETEGHTERVTRLTLELARLSGLSEKELTGIRWGAQLHDIGKMAIPDAVLLKPGPLTDEEWTLMKKHPLLAGEMLAPIRYLHQALEIPLHHHEKWDGTGYPRGLKGAQIPLAARLFAIVDIWDALCSDRPYRQAWSPQRALEYIQSLSGTHLDPKVVELFFASQVYNIAVPED